MRRIGLLIAPIALASLTSCGGDSISVPPSAIAVVGHRTISRAAFDAAMAQARASYTSQGRAFPAAGTAAYAGLQRLAVGVLVERAELEQEAPRVGVHVDEAQVEARLRRLKEDVFGGSDRRYRERLRAQQMTDAQVRSAIRAQLLVEEMREALTAGVTVGAEAVKEYYEQHVSDYSTPPARVVRHILVGSRALATRIERRVHDGTPFATLARRFSADASTRLLGGRLRLVEGRTSPTLDAVAFSLPTGAVSRPFRTRFGWELVQAVSAVTARRTVPLAAVRDGIRRHLLAVRRNEVFDHWLQQTTAKYARRTAYAPGFSPAGRAS